MAHRGDARDKVAVEGFMITRFAPSPSGLLHLGHAYAAWYAREVARREGGSWILRIEDIDETRCRLEYEEAIYEDLAWLGLDDWSMAEPVRRQSDHLDEYRERAQWLREAGFLYPCFCTRRDIAAAASAPHGSEGALYPGTCRTLSEAQRSAHLASGATPAWRLDLSRALDQVGSELTWEDATLRSQRAKPELLGDAVLVRKDIGTSYHLAVLHDDALQGVTRVTRGEDLLYATHLHRLLIELLGLPVPLWDHHSLITDEQGVRLAKRDGARALSALREAGESPRAILQRFEAQI